MILAFVLLLTVSGPAPFTLVNGTGAPIASLSARPVSSGGAFRPLGPGRLSPDARGSVPWTVELTTGTRLFVKTASSEERVADLLFRRWRRIRLKDPGDPRPAASLQTASAASGVVSFGLPASAMGLFPQIEYNLDSYPKSYGMHIHFITNAQGEGAQNRVRALLSGFQIPFVRA